MYQSVAGFILAAGYGKLGKGRGSKVLELLHNERKISLIERCVHLANEELEVFPTFIAVNEENHHEVKNLFQHTSGVTDDNFVLQNGRKGTAGVTSLCLERLQTEHPRTKHILIIYGDMPLLSTESVAALLQQHISSLFDPAISLFSIDTSREDCPAQVARFGRIIHLDDGTIFIKEHYEMSEIDKKHWQNSKKVNPSVWIFDRYWLEDNLSSLKPHDKGDGHPNEYWLPDLVPIAHQQGRTILEMPLHDPEEALGVNTLEELQMVQGIWQERIAI